MVASLEIELHPQTVWEPLVDVRGTAVQFLAHHWWLPLDLF